MIPMPWLPFLIVQLWIAFHTPVETSVRHEINPSSGITVLEAVRMEHQVKTGFVCFSENDIQCVDKLCQDPKRNLYWSINLNGDYSKVNSMTPLKQEDSLTLEYASLKEK